MGRQLTWIIDEGSQPSVAIPVAAGTQRASWRLAVVASLATLVVGSLITGIAVWSVMRPAPPRLTRFSISTGPQPSVSLHNQNVVISPDGTRIVYVASGPLGGPLHVRALDQLDPEALA